MNFLLIFFLLSAYNATTFSDALINWITLINFLIANKIPVIIKAIRFIAIIAGLKPNCFSK